MNAVVIVWIAFVTIFLLIAVITFTVIQQRRFIKQDGERKALEKEQEMKLAEAMIKSQELERKSIGENLHEDVAPILFLSLMDLNALMDKKEFPFGDQLKFTVDNISTAIKKIRDISHLIHPASVETFGFLKGLEDFSSIINSSQGCKLFIENKINEITLDSFKQLMLFRVVQEIVYNSIRHGKAIIINLILMEAGNELVIQIVHNGIKFLNEDFSKSLKSSGALGLKNIQHRLGLLHGKVSFDTLENNVKQKITISIPLS